MILFPATVNAELQRRLKGGDKDAVISGLGNDRLPDHEPQDPRHAKNAS